MGDVHPLLRPPPPGEAAAYHEQARSAAARRLESKLALHPYSRAPSRGQSTHPRAARARPQVLARMPRGRPPLEVRADAGGDRGKGLFATEDIEEGDIIFEERALVRRGSGGRA